MGKLFTQSATLAEEVPKLVLFTFQTKCPNFSTIFKKVTNGTTKTVQFEQKRSIFSVNNY